MKNSMKKIDFGIMGENEEHLRARNAQFQILYMRDLLLISLNYDKSPESLTESGFPTIMIASNS